MHAKYTTLGLLIYATMLLYAAAFVVALSRRRRLAMRIFAAGFLVASSAVLQRWYQAGYIPLSNMFEVMLVLSAMMFPLSVLCRRFLRAGMQAGDMFIGLVLLVPVGFVFSETPRQMPPALQSPLFVPHVAAYVLAYAILAKAALHSAAQLLVGDGPAGPSLATRRQSAGLLVKLAFPLLTTGLVLGAAWGKQAWGNWWNWDPKELWSLASWLVFAGYLHIRSTPGRRHPRMEAAIVLTGFALILITLLWANFSRLFVGLHDYA